MAEFAEAFPVLFILYTRFIEFVSVHILPGFPFGRRAIRLIIMSKRWKPQTIRNFSGPGSAAANAIRSA